MKSNILKRWMSVLLAIAVITNFLSITGILNVTTAKAATIANWVDGSGTVIPEATLKTTDWTTRLKFISPLNIHDNASNTTYTYKGDRLFQSREDGEGGGLLSEGGQFLYFPEGKAESLVLDDKSNCYGVMVVYITNNTEDLHLELAQPKLSSSGSACSINDQTITNDMDPIDSLRIIDASDWAPDYFGKADWLVAPFYWISKDSVGMYDTNRTTSKITDITLDNVIESLKNNGIYTGLGQAGANSTLEYWRVGECKQEVLITEKSNDQVLPYGYFVHFSNDPKDGIPQTARLIRTGEQDSDCMLGNRKLVDDSFRAIDYEDSTNGRKLLIPIALAAQVNNPESNPVITPPFSGGGSGGGDLLEGSCYSEISNVFGWLLCPIFQMTDAFIGWAENVLTNQLDVDLGSSDVRDDLESVWQQMARIASSLLVIVGLIMVASTAFGFKFFDAYTIKKVLPRLVIGAVGIWFSWAFITTYVNFMNFLGQSLGSIMLSQIDEGGFSLADIWARASSGAGAASTGVTVTGVGLISVLAGFSTLSAGPFVVIGLGLSALLGFATAIVALTIRQALIIFLAVLSPIAIVAWILPNTKGIWSKWFKLLSSLLLMYPMIVGTLAAGKIFGAITAARLGSTSDTTEEMLGIVISVLSYVGPLFLIPGLIKSSNSLMGKISGGVGKFANNATGGWQNSLKSRGEARKKFNKQMNTENLVAQAGRGGRRGAIAQARLRAMNGQPISGRALSVRGFGQQRAERIKARAEAGMYAATASIEKQQASEAEALLEGRARQYVRDQIAAGAFPDNTNGIMAARTAFMRDTAQAQNQPASIRQAALESMLKTGDLDGIDQSRSSFNATDWDKFTSGNYGDLKEKAPDLVGKNLGEISADAVSKMHSTRQQKWRDGVTQSINNGASDPATLANTLKQLNGLSDPAIQRSLPPGFMDSLYQSISSSSSGPGVIGDAKRVLESGGRLYFADNGSVQSR